MNSSIPGESGDSSILNVSIITGIHWSFLSYIYINNPSNIAYFIIEGVCIDWNDFLLLVREELFDWYKDKPQNAWPNVEDVIDRALLLLLLLLVDNKDSKPYRIDAVYLISVSNKINI